MGSTPGSLGASRLANQAILGWNSSVHFGSSGGLHLSVTNIHQWSVISNRGAAAHKGAAKNGIYCLFIDVVLDRVPQIVIFNWFRMAPNFFRHIGCREPKVEIRCISLIQFSNFLDGDLDNYCNYWSCDPSWHFCLVLYVKMQRKNPIW